MMTPTVSAEHGGLDTVDKNSATALSLALQSAFKENRRESRRGAIEEARMAMSSVPIGHHRSVVLPTVIVEEEKNVNEMETAAPATSSASATETETVATTVAGHGHEHDSVVIADKYSATALSLATVSADHELDSVEIVAKESATALSLATETFPSTVSVDHGHDSFEIVAKDSATALSLAVETFAATVSADHELDSVEIVAKDSATALSLATETFAATDLEHDSAEIVAKESATALSLATLSADHELDSVEIVAKEFATALSLATETFPSTVNSDHEHGSFEIVTKESATALSLVLQSTSEGFKYAPPGHTLKDAIVAPAPFLWSPQVNPLLRAHQDAQLEENAPACIPTGATLNEGQEAMWIEEYANKAATPNVVETKSRDFFGSDEDGATTAPPRQAKIPKFKKAVVLLPPTGTKEAERTAVLLSQNVAQEAMVNMTRARQLLTDALAAGGSPRQVDSERLAQYAFAHAKAARRLMYPDQPPAELETILSNLTENREYAAMEAQKIVISHSLLAETGEKVGFGNRDWKLDYKFVKGEAKKLLRTADEYMEKILPTNLDHSSCKNFDASLFHLDLSLRISIDSEDTGGSSLLGSHSDQGGSHFDQDQSGIYSTESTGTSIILTPYPSESTDASIIHAPRRQREEKTKRPNDSSARRAREEQTTSQ
jgi:hypothetical protein